jgi:hypothetical protein
LASRVHRQLNDDAVVPGLRVPTVFCPAADGRGGPRAYDLDVAERSFVVPLADNALIIDPAWRQFVARLLKSCRGSRHRCVPLQLSEHAYRSDAKGLNEVSFARAYLQPEGAPRAAFVVRRVVIELCRYLLGQATGDDRNKAPVTLFLSHAKTDLNVQPRVALRFIDYLKADQPVEAWVDSGKIPPGAEFAKEIEEGIKGSSVLAVLTDAYATREWCREEILLAKEHHRPLVVVDALKEHEIRSFPYLGNVPRLRWANDPVAGVDLLLKETLRDLHTRLLLERSRRRGDRLFTRPPELATLVGIKPGANVLYPDPPIGVGECRRISRLNVKFATPLERLAVGQPLKGKLIALSMSPSTDLDRFGMCPLHLESAMLELSRYLLIQGASLAYGGHLGTEGYSRKLFEAVQTHNALEGVQPFDRIVNHRAWPLPRLNTDQKAELDQVSRTVELPRPADVTEALHRDFTDDPQPFSPEDSARHRYAWARGMTAMREFQADEKQSKVVARVALGGTFGLTQSSAEWRAPKLRWYAGRVPGVFEEVMLSVRAKQPVFLIGAFGGAARMVIDLLQGHDREEATWDYQRKARLAPAMRELYENGGPGWWDYPDMIKELRGKGIKGVNRLLKEDEHVELFDTINPVRMVEIVLKGLSKL